MQKIEIFCNCCEAKVDPKEFGGGLMRIIQPQAFDRNNLQSMPMPPMPEAWDLCESCQKAIWKFAEQHKAAMSIVTQIKKS